MQISQFSSRARTGITGAMHRFPFSKKTFLRPLAAAGFFSMLLTAGIFSSGCRNHVPPVDEPVTHHEGGAHYAALFGQRYRTLVDLYLFTLVADPEYQYLGRNDGRPG